MTGFIEADTRVVKTFNELDALPIEVNFSPIEVNLWKINELIN